MFGLIKKCTIFVFAFALEGSSLAQDGVQELNTSAKVGDLPVTVHLEAREVSCSKRKQIQLNKMFCISVVISSPNAAAIKDLTLKTFDATMPEHRHGMVTRPKIKALKSGEYLIEGLKLHMPGEWKFSLELVYGKTSASVAIPLKL